jgi:putative hydrolase of the HAD superfamily
MGLEVSREGIVLGYALADDFFTRENSAHPLAERSPEERERFFAQYERLILKGAGLDVSLELAGRVWRLVSQIPKELALFDDVLPTLRALKGRGLILGALSNLRREPEDLSRRLGLSPYLDFLITSREAGAEKPHPTIFLAALRRAGVSPHEAIHCGDQYYSDVLGARAVGITPVLIDRAGVHTQIDDCARIRSLQELEGFLEG